MRLSPLLQIGFAGLLVWPAFAAHAAAPSCAELFAPRKGIATNGFSKADARILRHASAKINGFLGNLKRPAPTVARIDGYLFSFFHSGLKRIGFEFARKPRRLQTLAVFTHEYGHAVFEENFLVTIAGRETTLGSFVREREAVDERLARDPEYAALTKRRYELMLDESNPRELFEVIRRRKEIHDEATKHFDDRAQLEWEKARALSLAYDELFADLISALHARNPAAPAEGFGVPKSAPYRVIDQKGEIVASFETLDYRPRDFSAAVPREKFRPDGEQFHYTLFDPVRATIWKHVTASAPSDYGRVLEAYLRAAKKHYDTRLHRGELELSAPPLDPSKLNREFEALLERELGN